MTHPSIDGREQKVTARPARVWAVHKMSRQEMALAYTSLNCCEARDGHMDKLMDAMQPSRISRPQMSLSLYMLYTLAHVAAQMCRFTQGIPGSSVHASRVGLAWGKFAQTG